MKRFFCLVLLLFSFAAVAAQVINTPRTGPLTSLTVQRWTTLGTAVRVETGELTTSQGFILTSTDNIPAGASLVPSAANGQFTVPLSTWLSYSSSPFSVDYLGNYQRSPATYTITGVVMVAVTVRSGTGGTDIGGTTTQGKFSNLSTRGFVGSGANLMIVGIAVTDNPKTVLVRAIGPSLATFGITGVLSQPILEIYDSKSQVIFRNVGWGTQPATTVAGIKTKSVAVGAFAIPDNSNDSVLLVTLQPGNYSVQITGVNDGTGVAIAEVYEAP